MERLFEWHPVYGSCCVAPSLDAMQKSVEWAVDKLNEGCALLVHCAHGHGRSATVLGAILIEIGEAENVDDAVKVMKKGRPRVRLNQKQQKALNEWFDRYHRKER